MESSNTNPSQNPSKFPSNDELLRTSKISDAHQERLKRITEKVFNVFFEEKVVVGEFPQIIQALNQRIGSVVNKIELDQISNLDK